MDIKLYNIDSKGKIRYVSFLVVDKFPGYEIKRSSGLVDGADVPQPTLEIKIGKAGRCIKAQMELEYNSLINKARDKGYKDQIADVMEHKTDSNGNKKPMLALDCRGKIDSKVSEDDARKIIITRILRKINEKVGYLSRKLDGVRMIKKLIGTVSRGGKDYDPACTQIVKDGCFKEFFDKYPDYQLDGEIYVHGKFLDEISGHARKREYIPERHDDLQYWIYDIIADGLTFEERLKILKEIKPTTNRVVIVEHIRIEPGDIETVMKLHDEWVLDGYEGGIWREADATYKIGGRDARMIKVKLMQDDEFEIVGATEGLRPEDMVFNLITDKGVDFEAKPTGSVAKRLEYLEHIKDYIGKKATIKFFHYSPKGAPNLPIFKCIRESDE